jgi:hypothetical protein
MWSHSHPPFPQDLSLYKQTELTEVTPSELLEYRKLPTYSFRHRVLHLLYFLIFGVVRIITLLLFITIAVPIFLSACTLWRIAGRPESARFPLRRLWASITRVLLFILGFVKIEFHGDIDPEARFLVGNHITFFDGWLFAGHPLRPVIKKELMTLPLLGHLGDVYDPILVDRSRATGLTKVLADSAKNPAKPPIMILPEGASTSGDYMLRFHLGAFLSDLPVQLMAIRYRLWGTSRQIAHMSFFHHHPYHMLVLLGVPWITVDVHFLGSLSLKEIQGQDPRVLADTAGLRIANALGVRMLSLTSSALYKSKTG